MTLIVMSMLMILHLKAYSVVVLKRRRIVIIFGFREIWLETVV